MVWCWKTIDMNQESNGLRTEPCGTPALGLIWLDKKLFTLTCMTRTTRKSESQRVILVGRSDWKILNLSPLCQTLSEAFSTSRKAASTCSPLLGTVHYLLGVRDRCFGVRDKDFFNASKYGTQRFFVLLWYGHELFLEKNLSNYICIISRGGNSHRSGYKMCHF